jgi:formate C-acetyltransferase
LRLRNRCPKFGNDDAHVDSLAVEIAEVFMSEGQSYTNPRGGRYCPGFFDFAGYVLSVKSLGATPDGRRAGESVSGHLAPVGGTDRNGVTASLRSMSRVTSLHPPMGTMFDIKLHPTAVRGETGTEKLGALIRAFLELDGKALQFNIVDAATLRAAQLEPEKYRDLLVRVWGFSAYFVELSKDFQEHIINRTEHGL